MCILFGVILTSIIFFLFLWWEETKSDGVWLVDKWWGENPERWESLRKQLMKED